MSWRRAPAGFVSGPRKLKIVRTASSLRTGTTYRVAAWWAGANMKPKPARSMQRATASGLRSMRAPSASSTSADPLSPVAERLPCLASAQPAPAAMSAAVVETLNVGRPPPVPAVSTRSSRAQGTGVASARIVPARPASSSTVSPFVRSAIRKPAICASVASPRMISASTAPACSRARSRPDARASMARVRMSFGKEVLQQPAAGLGEDGLGVELHALGGQLAVAQGHDDAAAAGGDLEGGGHVVGHDQGVVSAHGERRVEPGEQRAAVVLDRRRLAVHRDVPDDAPAERLGQRLVAQADPERPHAGLGEAAHGLERDPGLVGRARPGRDDDAVEAAPEQIVHGGAVVAHHLEVAAQLAQILDEVVGERVVVVDDQHPHGQSGCSMASSTARSTARALCSDSANSYAGWASATVPPPACTCARPSFMTTVRMWIAVSRSPV